MNSERSTLSAEVCDLIDRLDLEPHPEGGWYRQTFHDEASDGSVASTAIYFLLPAGERSHWHRVLHAAEVWHHYAGDPLRLSVSHDGVMAKQIVLGIDVLAGGQQQAVVPAGDWQSAESLGAWTLVGCTVAPGFRFDQFELAPVGWEPQATRRRT
ncbi:MAG: cupin domain-containing protein [Ilumatobacter sp.]